MIDDLSSLSLPELRAQLERHQQRESELLALHETARDLTALRDVDRVLHAIVRRARQLLSADVSYLSVYDGERRDFYIRATEGSVSPAFARIRVPLDVGICGLVAAEKVPHYSSAYATDERFRHSGGIDHGVLAEQIESLLGVPLLADEEVIGVLFVADRYQRAYSPQQIALLDSLGAHASAAMENARLFQEAREALAREREANARLQERTREIQSAADVHEQLTSLLASGGDLDAFAAVVARELGGRVVVVDGTLAALGDSGGGGVTDADRGAADANRGAADADRGATDANRGAADADRGADPLAPALREALQRSAQLGRSLRLEAPAAWVAAAGAPSGAPGGLVLWRAGTLSSPQVRTLERAAVMVALMLLVRERVAAAEQRALGDLIGGLLKHPQGEPATLARGVRRHGLALDGPLAVIVSRRGEPDPQTVQAVRAALGDGCLAGPFDGELVAIASAADAAAVATRLHAALAPHHDPAGAANDPAAPRTRDARADPAAPRTRDPRADPAAPRTRDPRADPAAPRTRDPRADPAAPRTRDPRADPAAPRTRDPRADPAAPRTRDPRADPAAPRTRDPRADPAAPRTRDPRADPAAPRTRDPRADPAAPRTRDPRADPAAPRTRDARADGGATVSFALADGRAELPDAHRRALQATELLLALGRAGAVAPESALAPYALLLSERGRGDLRQFVDGQLGALIEWDARRSTDLTGTLLTYFDCGHSTSATAAALHVHPNTLRQRLDRVTALLPGWAQPERMLELHLALRLHALRDRVTHAARA